MHKGLLHTAHENVSEEELEGQVDWRTEGAVSDVKDQGEFLNTIVFLPKIGIFWSKSCYFGSKILVMGHFLRQKQILD